MAGDSTKLVRRHAILPMEAWVSCLTSVQIRMLISRLMRNTFNDFDCICS